MRQQNTAFPLLLLVLGYFPLSAQTVEKTLDYSTVRWEGLRKTDSSWIEEYTGLNCPCSLAKSDMERLRIKLLTTQVFQDVQVFGEQNSSISPTLTLPEQVTSSREENTLIVRVKEKWTVIPVVRGAFGGGTPLLVAGVYDTHAFGRLLTLGAETRKYGNARPGGVAWVRAPRWRQGRHYWNLEVWKDERLRNFYDSEDQVVATLKSSASKLVTDALWPLTSDGAGSWQYGARLLYRHQEKLAWENQGTLPSVKLDENRRARFLARLVYDNLRVEGLQLEGLRTLFAGGPTLTDDKTLSFVEHELFAYKIWQKNWNLSWHHWLGMSDDVSYQSLFFLGGFDSIRGLPDGTLYGSRAAYSNLELRYLAYKTQFTWWQTAVYLDYGTAAETIADLEARDRLSIGTGLRVAIPQVNRLMFRLDYAWSLSEPRTSSISVGMNQFIDPYRPL